VAWRSAQDIHETTRQTLGLAGAYFVPLQGYALERYQSQFQGLCCAQADGQVWVLTQRNATRATPYASLPNEGLDAVSRDS
jgi:hypothetical protein